MVLLTVGKWVRARDLFAVAEDFLAAAAEEGKALRGNEGAEEQGKGGGGESHGCDLYRLRRFWYVRYEIWRLRSIELLGGWTLVGGWSRKWRGACLVGGLSCGRHTGYHGAQYGAMGKVTHSCLIRDEIE